MLWQDMLQGFYLRWHSAGDRRRHDGEVQDGKIAKQHDTCVSTSSEKR